VPIEGSLPHLIYSGVSIGLHICFLVGYKLIVTKILLYLLGVDIQVPYAVHSDDAPGSDGPYPRHLRPISIATGP
jgi:hypothetical protein